MNDLALPEGGNPLSSPQKKAAYVYVVRSVKWWYNLLPPTMLMSDNGTSISSCLCFSFDYFKSSCVTARALFSRITMQFGGVPLPTDVAHVISCDVKRLTLVRNLQPEHLEVISTVLTLWCHHEHSLDSKGGWPYKQGMHQLLAMLLSVMLADTAKSAVRFRLPLHRHIEEGGKGDQNTPKLVQLKADMILPDLFSLYCLVMRAVRPFYADLDSDPPSAHSGNIGSAEIEMSSRDSYVLVDAEIDARTTTHRMGGQPRNNERGNLPVRSVLSSRLAGSANYDTPNKPNNSNKPENSLQASLNCSLDLTAAWQTIWLLTRSPQSSTWWKNFKAELKIHVCLSVCI
jgi:hypothetical protein